MFAASFRPAILTLAIAILALPAQASILFGTFNAAGTGAAETALPDGIYSVGGGAFRVVSGRIAPDGDLLGATPGVHEIAAGGVTERIELRDNHLCVAGRDELVAAIARETLGGMTLCLRAGRYEMHGPDFEARFQNIPDAAPLTVRSADPDAPAVLTRWIMSGGGNVTLTDLEFFVASEELPLGAQKKEGSNVAVILGRGTKPPRNVVIENVTFRGTQRNGREGGREPADLMYGIYANVDGLTVRNSRFTQLSTAMHLTGDGITVERNRGWHNGADFIQISGRGKKECWPTRNVTIRENIFSDVWSNGRLHPDFVQLYPAYNMECGVSDVLIEGNIVYLGETVEQPAFPTGLKNSAPVKTPPKLPFEERRYWRLIGPGTTELPKASCPDGEVKFGIQLQPESTGPVRLVPARGQQLRLNTRDIVRHYDLAAEWEAWEVLCPGRGANRWELRQAVPGIQAIFANHIPGREGYTNVTIRNNIFWINMSSGISFRDEDNANFVIERNSILQVFPGDTDGDGAANTTADGFNRFHSTPRITYEGSDAAKIERNISGGLHGMDPAYNRMNDLGIQTHDGGGTMRQRFTPGPGGTFHPRTPREAVEMARPRTDGMNAHGQVGAVGVNAASDPYDWSWVPAE